MVASLIYDGEISAATIVTAIGAGTTFMAIPYSNGQRVLVIKLA